MNNFWQRTITGTFLVSAIIGSLIYDFNTAFLFFSAVAVLGLREFLTITLPKSKHAFTLFVGVCFILLIGFYAQGKLTLYSLAFGIPLLFLLFTEGLFSNSETGFNDVSSRIFGLIYTILPFGLLFLLGFVTDSTTYNYQPVLGVFIMIWCNDTFAYLTGRAFGKRKLFERISPKKTIEGTLGGMIISALIGYFVLAHFYTSLSQIDWAVGALIVGVGGTLGDLFESLLKRNYGIKDSGNILPGHGGILDRFDSVIFALPLFFAWLVLTNF